MRTKGSWLSNPKCANTDRGIFCSKYTFQLDKPDMTLVQGQWPWVTGRTGWNQGALFLEKSVFYEPELDKTDKTERWNRKISRIVYIYDTILENIEIQSHQKESFLWAL